MKNSSKNNSVQSENPHPEHQKLLKVRQKAERLLLEGRYAESIDLLNSILSFGDARNLKGVCQLRMGAFESAVQNYRPLVLDSRTSMVHAGVPDIHITNFATALLLSGRPEGCLEILASVHAPKSPQVIQLHEAIRQWSKTLGWWDWFNWKVGKMSPSHCVVPVTFLPGTYESQLPLILDTDSAAIQSAHDSACRKTAI